MTHNKTATAAVPTQSPAKQSSQKHSNPFYISNSLFQNKWIKQQRCQLLEARKMNYQKKKARYLKKLAELKADVTIDLLSDDEEEPSQKTISEVPPVQQPFQPMIPLQLQLLANDGKTMQISQVPNITLIPMQNLQNIAMPLPKVLKRNKRKTRPRKRLPPRMECTESIVLTDDDDDGEGKSEKESVSTMLPQLAINTQIFQTQPQILPQPQTQLQSPNQPQALPQPPTTQLTSGPLFTQVDEEVSVSLVPRTKPSGTCSTPNSVKADTLFPMLPDETTVHTVIANRIYELSLSKLREGLATCGIPEFADEQQRQLAKSRRNTTFAPPIATPPPAPVSLKLSSDLSISLISDDEPEDETITLAQLSPSLKIRTMHSTTELQQRQAQQQAFPLINGNQATAHQKPRKRKLG